jgi:hypothetical protein
VCPDLTPADGFTTADLAACIRASHEGVVDRLLELEFDPALRELRGPDLPRCQAQVARRGAALVACVLDAVRRCRTQILEGRIDVAPQGCAHLDPRTSAAVAACRARAEAAIAGSCTDEAASTLRLCTPDQTSAAGAALCIDATHTSLADDPSPDASVDLIDLEFGAVGPTGACADDGGCAALEYCAKPRGACFGAGACVMRPEACIALYDPVCGCDGHTWGNACDAAAAGVNLAYEGVCSSGEGVSDR